MPTTLPVRGEAQSSTAIHLPRAGAIPAPRSIQPLPDDYWRHRRPTRDWLAIGLLVGAIVSGTFAIASTGTLIVVVASWVLS